MFEDKELADQAVVAVEKTIHHEDMQAKGAEGTVETVENAPAEQPGETGETKTEAISKV